MKTICVVGAGRLGKTLAQMAKSPQTNVEMWDIVPGIVKNQKPLQAIVPNADILFLCINSWHIRNAAKLLRPYLTPHTLIVSPTKGIEPRTRFTIDALLADAFPGQPIALLSGPMLAHDLAKGKFGGAVVATKRTADFQMVKTVFARSPLQLSHTTDLRATALAGVLKNAYALLLGIADALNLGQNAKGTLAAMAAEEMVRAIGVLHLQKSALHTFFGPAGLSDLLATGFSPKSTNVAVGRDLAAGRTPTRMSEGLASLPPLMKLLGKRVTYFPLLQTVYGISIKQKKTNVIRLLLT
jgi:glycerol-3-phosphate dehydrogenase (NAD(P)+)